MSLFALHGQRCDSKAVALATLLHAEQIQAINFGAESEDDPSAEQAPSPVHAVYGLEEVVVKQLAANGHLHLIEGVLQHKVAIQVVYPAGHTACSTAAPCATCTAARSLHRPSNTLELRAISEGSSRNRMSVMAGLLSARAGNLVSMHTSCGAAWVTPTGAMQVCSGQPSVWGKDRGRRWQRTCL